MKQFLEHINCYRNTFKIVLWLCAGLLVLILSMALPLWADLLNLRYSLPLLNPHWLNFQVVSLTAFMIVFLLGLVLSRQVMLLVIPFAVVIIVLASVGIKNVSFLPSGGEDGPLLACLRSSGSDMAKSAGCYEIKATGVLAPLWEDYCDKKAIIGKDMSAEAKSFRRARCRYNKMKMEFLYANYAD